MPKAATETTAKQLTDFFQRNGYVRRQNSDRLSEVGSQSYRKGDEVRLVANTRVELALIRRLLRAAGFKPGRAFTKGRQYRQPLYGRAEVARFLELVGQPLDAR